MRWSGFMKWLPGFQSATWKDTRVKGSSVWVRMSSTSLTSVLLLKDVARVATDAVYHVFSRLLKAYRGTMDTCRSSKLSLGS